VSASRSREDDLTRLARVLQERLGRLCRGRLRELVDRVGHVIDPGMRSRRFLGLMASEPPAVAVEMLVGLEELARRRYPAAQRLYLDLLNEGLVREMLPEKMISEIWRLGRVRGHHRLLETFFWTSGIDGRLETAPPLPPDIRDIPLGRRKAMARLGDMDGLARLLRDNDTSVIGNLLANPRLTEREVVSLVARRPNSAAILTMVASNRRWIPRYAVKKALVWNPETPARIALTLLKYLVRSDLREICRSSATGATVRRAARGLLEAEPK
jgi:hypothetical protein